MHQFHVPVTIHIFFSHFYLSFVMDQKQIEILKNEVKEDESTKAEKIRELKEILENHPFIFIPKIGKVCVISVELNFM